MSWNKEMTTSTTTVFSNKVNKKIRATEDAAIFQWTLWHGSSPFWPDLCTQSARTSGCTRQMCTAACPGIRNLPSTGPEQQCTTNHTLPPVSTRWRKRTELLVAPDKRCTQGIYILQHLKPTQQHHCTKVEWSNSAHFSTPDTAHTSFTCWFKQFHMLLWTGEEQQNAIGMWRTLLQRKKEWGSSSIQAMQANSSVSSIWLHRYFSSIHILIPPTALAPPLFTNYCKTTSYNKSSVQVQKVRHYTSSRRVWDGDNAALMYR